VKSSVHFRAEFEPLAEEVLLLAAPGRVQEAIDGLAYRRLRPGQRLKPLGKPFQVSEQQFEPVSSRLNNETGVPK